MAVIPIITAAMTAVFAFQFAGCEYHPPAGDQTCLGYLNCILAGIDDWKSTQVDRSAYGIFPPDECSIAAPFLIEVSLIEESLIEGSLSMIW